MAPEDSMSFSHSFSLRNIDSRLTTFQLKQAEVGRPIDIGRSSLFCQADAFTFHQLTARKTEHFLRSQVKQ
jgi:hypothetical protein